MVACDCGSHPADLISAALFQAHTPCGGPRRSASSSLDDPLQPVTLINLSLTLGWIIDECTKQMLWDIAKYYDHKTRRLAYTYMHAHIAMAFATRNAEPSFRHHERSRAPTVRLQTHVPSAAAVGVQEITLPVQITHIMYAQLVATATTVNRSSSVGVTPKDLRVHFTKGSSFQRKFTCFLDTRWQCARSSSERASVRQQHLVSRGRADVNGGCDPSVLHVYPTRDYTKLNSMTTSASAGLLINPVLHNGVCLALCVLVETNWRTASACTLFRKFETLLCHKTWFSQYGKMVLSENNKHQCSFNGSDLTINAVQTFVTSSYQLEIFSRELSKNRQIVVISFKNIIMSRYKIILSALKEISASSFELSRIGLMKGIRLVVRSSDATAMIKIYKVFIHRVVGYHRFARSEFECRDIKSGYPRNISTQPSDGRPSAAEVLLLHPRTHLEAMAKQKRTRHDRPTSSIRRAREDLKLIFLCMRLAHLAWQYSGDPTVALVAREGAAAEHSSRVRQYPQLAWCLHRWWLLLAGCHSAALPQFARHEPPPSDRFSVLC
ncbi:hypothetical protein B566_EDAN000706 [Ephemera danica]|nr:hypothetical protein B566_EDAN000706 [Ephemera danica]